MDKYTVRSGQNIYDVSMALYGSVEGVFDLLVCNQWLNMEMPLKPGMELLYHPNLMVSKSNVSWAERNSVVYRNGEHPIDVSTALDVLKDHIRKRHPARWEEILQQPEDVQREYWDWLAIPRMTVTHHGTFGTVRASFLHGTHMVVDWGDTSPMLVMEGTGDILADHSYKSAEAHRITLYGDFRCSLLDISGLYGPYYASGPVFVDRFVPSDKNPKLKALVIPEEGIV